MFRTNRAGLRVAWSRLAEYIRTHPFNYDYCDTIANCVRDLVSVAPETTIIRDATSALARLGSQHNRWHVRDTLVRFLQTIRDPEQALAALEGLQEVRPAEVAWNISGFAARTMYPTLRRGIEEIHRVASAGI